MILWEIYQCLGISIFSTCNTEMLLLQCSVPSHTEAKATKLLFPNRVNRPFSEVDELAERLIANIKAQRQNFSNVFKDCIIKYMCDIPKLKNK